MMQRTMPSTPKNIVSIGVHTNAIAAPSRWPLQKLIRDQWLKPPAQHHPVLVLPERHRLPSPTQCLLVARVSPLR